MTKRYTLNQLVPAPYLRHLFQTSVVDIESNAGVKIEPIEQSRVDIETLSTPFDDGYVDIK